MKNRRDLLLILCIVCLAALPACQGTAPVAATPLPSVTPTVAGVPDKIPSPAAGKGSVVGQLKGSKPESVIGLLVYLGGIVLIGENMTGGVLDTSKAPSTLVDAASGKFYFRDVEPGKYSLIIYDVGMGGSAYQDSSGNVYVVEVKPDSVIDLGAIPLGNE
jgi:hypothetical protein